VISANSRLDSEVKTRKLAQCVAQLARSGYTFKKKEAYSDYLDYDAGGCYAYYEFKYKSVQQVLAIADAPAPTFMTSDAPSSLGTGLLTTGVLAVVAYLFFYCIGWLCAGFTRDA
jgi:Na+/proline symporter